MGYEDWAKKHGFADDGFTRRAFDEAVEAGAESERTRVKAAVDDALPDVPRVFRDRVKQFAYKVLGAKE